MHGLSRLAVEIGHGLIQMVLSPVGKGNLHALLGQHLDDAQPDAAGDKGRLALQIFHGDSNLSRREPDQLIPGRGLAIRDAANGALDAHYLAGIDLEKLRMDVGDGRGK